MKKKTSIWILLVGTFIGLSSFAGIYYTKYRVIDNNIFYPGEVMEYDVEFGFINAGVGTMVVSDNIHRINGRACYKIDIFGNTTGITDFFMHVDDTWGSYLDTTSIIPHRSYRIIEEGKFRKHEIVYFNQLQKNVKVVDYNYKTQSWKDPVQFDIPFNAHDMVSGYYYLRLLNFDTLKPGDIINLDGFLENEVFNFDIRYVGKDKVKTRLGLINALVLSPIMPENTLFDGENSIRIWISDDRNKVPLKVKASMFLGAVEINIRTYKPGKR